MTEPGWIRQQDPRVDEAGLQNRVIYLGFFLTFYEMSVHNKRQIQLGDRRKQTM